MGTADLLAGCRRNVVHTANNFIYFPVMYGIQARTTRLPLEEYNPKRNYGKKYEAFACNQTGAPNVVNVKI